MTTTFRLLLAVTALGWLVLTVAGGLRFGLESARAERATAIDRALDDPAVVAELREAAVARAGAEFPEVTALVAPLVDDAIAEAVAAQPVVRRLVAAEVDDRLGLGHEPVTITDADVPASLRSLLAAAGVELAIEVMPGRPADGGPAALLETVTIGAGVVTALAHLASARLVGRPGASVAGCAGAVIGLGAVAVGVGQADRIADPIRGAVVATAVPMEVLGTVAVLIVLLAGRAALAGTGRLPYGALDPGRFGFVGDDPGW